MGFRRLITGCHKRGGFFDAFGMYQEGTRQAFQFFASVQPLTAEEKAQYASLTPEGFIQSSMIKLYTKYPLISANEAEEDAEGTEGDVIEWLGREYEIVAIFPHQNGIISHWKAIGQEVKRNESASGSDDAETSAGKTDGVSALPDGDASESAENAGYMGVSAES